MRVAINGFGRIGRLVFRIMEEYDDMEVVAINNLKEAKQLAYLLKYDTCHRKYRPDEISYDDNHIIIGDRKILCLAEEEPERLPWKDLNIDIVFECTGAFTDEEGANKHIIAGAKKVVISAPAKGNVKTIVYGVNEEILNGSEKIISAASCTTNCLAPMLKVINDSFGIKRGYMTTVHAYTNDQSILDVTHKKGIESRRGRAACENIIPTSTGAASAIGLVIPELEGRLKGAAMRVPVPDGSVVDLVLELDREVSVPMINNAFIKAKSEVLDATYDPIVSSDVIGDSHGGVVDLLLTDVLETDGKQLVKLVGWYDNEMGYSHQMVRCARYFGKL
ncbi:MAG: type I glyceraldehyde-3-phosphate dehydrogenase [Bacilli bacterium]|nr:type I glyceraldehyde-3-phosphate dehydrogenase [Bacilli bacterium]